MVSKEFLIEKSEGNGEEVGTSVDSVAMVSVLSACSCVSNKAVSEGVHGVAMKVGLDKVMGVENTLLDAYIKCSEMSLPGRVLEFYDCCVCPKWVIDGCFWSFSWDVKGWWW